MRKKCPSLFTPDPISMKILDHEPAELLETAPPASVARSSARPSRPATRRRAPVGLLVGTFLVLSAGLVVGILPRIKARTVLQEQKEVLSEPSVTVISPHVSRKDAEFVVPGEVRPFVEAPIYARTNGYVKRWLADIGTEVKAGDILAEIDTPELDQELANARAQAVQAEASAQLAKTTAARYNTLRKTSVISAQDADEKNAAADASEASSQAARANVHRLEDLQAFQKVTAPFDGIITERDTDVGQLVSSTAAHPLFQLTQARTLRVFVHVPEAHSRSISVGQNSAVSFTEFPGRTFEAKVVRTAGAIDLASRTLLTELSLDNAKGEILAGSHAEVKFSMPPDKPLLTLPSNALLFRSEGPQAGVVNSDGKVELRSVRMGRDFGREIEIVTGISEKDRVILNPADSLASGIVVRVVEQKAAAAPKGK